MSKGYQQNYLTPGEYAQLADSGDKRLKYGMWRAGRATDEENRLRDIAYRSSQESKAAKAKGIGGLAKVGGAALGAGLGIGLAPATGGLSLLALAPAASSLASGAGDLAGGSSSDVGAANGALGTSAAALASSMNKPTATPPPDPNANLMLQDIGNPDAFQLKTDEEKARELWFAQRGGV